MKVHTKPELCDYCGKSFTLKKFLRNHVISVHLTDSDKPYRSFSPTCISVCGIVVYLNCFRPLGVINVEKDLSVKSFFETT